MEPQRSQLSKKEKKATEDVAEDGPHLPQRRGFDSDEDTENVEAASSGSVTGSRWLVPQQAPTEPQMTEEEKNISTGVANKDSYDRNSAGVTDGDIYYVAEDQQQKPTAGSRAVRSLRGQCR